jgi:hypothetical protein
MNGNKQEKEIKLTIELVPETCWMSNVRSAISPEDWDKIKRMCATRAGNLCEICKGRGPKWAVECHEVWHYDDKTKIQTLMSMTSLCPSCHEVKHMGFAGVRGREKEATMHLAKVNGWTSKQAAAYVDEQFEVWKKRSRKQWTLNLDFLDKLNVKVTVINKERC